MVRMGVGMVHMEVVLRTILPHIPPFLLELEVLAFGPDSLLADLPQLSFDQITTMDILDAAGGEVDTIISMEGPHTSQVLGVVPHLVLLEPLLDLPAPPGGSFY